ncbi:MAG TPA: 50S ribosomal protein L23 [Patescibacteria group bacterium]|nr:50S ribosomal protein L23 [Patescibacteria group bacterium]
MVRPVISEKSIKDAENGRFTFIVALQSSKDEIKKVVEETYKVHVLDVATAIVKGKTKRVGKKRTEKALGSYKKAVVVLEKGQKIDEFELGEQKK